MNRSQNLESIIIEINSKKAIFLDVFCLGFSPKTETENVLNITCLAAEISSDVYSTYSHCHILQVYSNENTGMS